MEGKAVGRVDFDLYLITDRHRTGGRPLREVLKRASMAGVRAIQLREKDLAARSLLDLAKEVKGYAPQVKLFINDRLDVALAARADGVHLGQKGLPPGVVRERFDEILIGVSTHSLEEALEAEAEGADFITFGPVFYTPSKASYGPPLGIERLGEVVERVRIPVFAIGGIRKENIHQVIGAGAHGVALISAIMGALDIEETTKGILEEIGKAKKTIRGERP